VDYGLSVTGNGSASWNPSAVASGAGVPPGVSSSVANAAANWGNLDDRGKVMAGVHIAMAAVAATGVGAPFAAFFELFIAVADMFPAKAAPDCCTHGGCPPWRWSWGETLGWYALPPPGSFEEYANAMLRTMYPADGQVIDICQTPVDNWGTSGPAALVQMLGLAIGAWNAEHSGPTRTICRAGLNRVGSQKQGSQTVPAYYMPGNGTDGGANDPIAYALAAVASLPGGPGSGPADTANVWGQTITLPTHMQGASVCFDVNDGPAISQRLTITGGHGLHWIGGPGLHWIGGPGLHLGIANIGPSSGAPAPMSSTAKVVLAAGGAIALVALLKPALLRGLLPFKV
jgi:hypothetical protein